MKISSNTPKIFSKYQDQALQAPSVEDGNTADESLQGKIMTSELTSGDNYNISYSATIFSFSTKAATTGNLYTYSIVIKYNAILNASATNPGYYGSNLIKENEAFVISSTSHDWIRGFISKVDSVSFTNVGSTYTYTYTLSCSITQGNPLDILTTDTFSWGRQRYMDESSFNNAFVATQVTATVNKVNCDTYIYWTDTNEESLAYKVQKRATNSTSGGTIFDVNGTDANFRGIIKPYVNPTTTDVSTIKIVDPGINTHSNRTIELIGPGIGSKWGAYFDNKGYLLINEFEVYQADVGTATIYLRALHTDDYCKSYPIALTESYVEGLPSITDVTLVYACNVVTAITDRTFSVTLKYANSASAVVIPATWSTSVIYTKIKTHDGIRRLSLSGLTGTSILGNNKFTFGGNNSRVSPYFLGGVVTSGGAYPSGSYITEVGKDYFIVSGTAVSGGNATITITGSGTGYSSKTRAKVKEINNNVKCYIDPAIGATGYIDYTQEYAISVAAIYSLDKKNYTEWTEEEYIINQL